MSGKTARKLAIFSWKFRHLPVILACYNHDKVDELAIIRRDTDDAEKTKICVIREIRG